VYNKGAKLYDFTDQSTVNDHGVLQLQSQTGLLVNIACYHGEKLPDNTKEVWFFWNGKRPSYNLTALKFVDGAVYGIYTCVDCGHSWRTPLKELIPFIGGDNADLKNRLIEKYCPELKVKKDEVI